jgi:hypothetical protein
MWPATRGRSSTRPEDSTRPTWVTACSTFFCRTGATITEGAAGAPSAVAAEAGATAGWHAASTAAASTEAVAAKASRRAGVEGARSGAGLADMKVSWIKVA